MEVNRIIEVPGQTWDERQSDAELDALYAAITGRRTIRSTAAMPTATSRTDAWPCATAWARPRR